MNWLEYNFSSDQDEGTSSWQSLKADVCFDRDPEDGGTPEVKLDIWVSFIEDERPCGKPEMESFDAKTAVALRDFLIFCFPLNGKP